MKVAVIKTGGRQYRVSEGQTLLVERIKGKKEKEKIRFVDLLSKKTVSARILGEEKGKKLVVLKYKARKRYRRKAGHRQIFTKIKIEEIR